MTRSFKTVRLPAELCGRIDAVRGDVPRDRWVRRALDAALGSDPRLLRDMAAGVRPTAHGSPSPSLERFRGRP